MGGVRSAERHGQVHWRRAQRRRAGAVRSTRLRCEHRCMAMGCRWGHVFACITQTRPHRAVYDGGDERYRCDRGVKPAVEGGQPAVWCVCAVLWPSAHPVKYNGVCDPVDSRHCSPSFPAKSAPLAGQCRRRHTPQGSQAHTRQCRGAPALAAHLKRSARRVKKAPSPLAHADTSCGGWQKQQGVRDAWLQLGTAATGAQDSRTAHMPHARGGRARRCGAPR